MVTVNVRPQINNSSILFTKYENHILFTIFLYLVIFVSQWHMAQVQCLVVHRVLFLIFGVFMTRDMNARTKFHGNQSNSH